MKRRCSVCLIWVILLLLPIFLVNIPPAQSQYSVPLWVARVGWGGDLDSPTKAYPGDTEVSLTMEVQNLSPDRTIKGASAVLSLAEVPFTDVYGSQNATATGEPTVGDILSPTDVIEPKGFFTLTFTLDIDAEAVPDSYSLNMSVEYSVEQTRFDQTQYIEGEMQALVIQITVSKIESVVAISISPQTVGKGELITVGGSIEPVKENATVTLNYRSPEGSEFSTTVKTNADGYFSETHRPDIDGFWSVNASWLGDGKYDGSWSATSFEVRLPISTEIATTNNRLTGGLDNQFNITVLNDSEVPITAVEATLDIPTPLIIHGNNRWTLDYLAPQNSTRLVVQIYAPESSIGTTYAGSFNLNYRDSYGESRSDSFPIGLVITGRVELVAYGKTVRPETAKNGTRVEITTTLLNKGNIPAMYVNASILPNAVLVLTEESTVYVGEVEENSQSPFTLAANVDVEAENGTYPIIISVAYRDDRYVDHSLNTSVYLTVKTGQPTPPSSGGTEGVFNPLSEEGFVLLTMFVASAVILLIYRGHVAGQRRNQNVLAGQNEHSSAIQPVI